MKSISISPKRISALAAILFATRCQAFLNATMNTNNPMGASYNAELPLSSSIQGNILAGAEANGTLFSIYFTGLPLEGGPFLYHIHASAVPANGSCMATGGHLDPTNRTETPPCDPTNPAQCQVGDLSGKYGNISTTDGTFSASYVDPYVSLNPENSAYFGDLSFVIHFANLTRITCANFAGNPASSPSSSPSSVQSSVPSSALNPFSSQPTLNPFQSSGSAVSASVAAVDITTSAPTSAPSVFQGSATRAIAGSKPWLVLGFLAAMAL